MRNFIFPVITISFIACNSPKPNAPLPIDTAETNKHVQVNFTIDVNQPTVGISNYTLISNNLQKDSAEARLLMQAKVILPLAMQKHDSLLFESTLARDFIYAGEEAFLNRKEYIHDRVNAEWMISDVQYENLVLEFLGEYGILTYRNRVKEKDEFGKDQLYTWFWTDIWIKENGSWKLNHLRALN